MSDDLKNNQDADEALNLLLGPEIRQAIIDATNAQFMSYAPMIGPAAPSHRRFVQLLRVGYEFTVGLPIKLFNYWVGSMAKLTGTSDGSAMGALAKLLLPVMLPVSVLLALVAFAHGFWTALWLSVIKREMEFVPKQELIDSLNASS